MNIMADDIQELSKQIVEVFATGDLSNVSSLVARDYVDHQGLSRTEIFGRVGFVRVVLSARANSGELRIRVEDLIAGTDRVALRLHWRGNLPVESPNSAGRAFDRETLDIIRFANGQMIERWGAELWFSERPSA